MWLIIDERTKRTVFGLWCLTWLRGLLRWFVFTIVMGGLIEVAQHFAPRRSMSFDDFLADAAGAACGLLLALLWLAVVVRPLRRAAA